MDKDLKGFRVKMSDCNIILEKSYSFFLNCCSLYLNVLICHNYLLSIVSNQIYEKGLHRNEQFEISNQLVQNRCQS